MGQIVLPFEEGWLEKPVPGTRINMAHPIVRDMRYFYMFDNISKCYDCLFSNHGSRTNNMDLVNTPQGVGCFVSGAGGGGGEFVIPFETGAFDILADTGATFLMGVTPTSNAASF